ncbi:MAG TPA: SCO family protein [Luteibacter sp.]|jgi:protein SCO1/2|nr:SCO family protein [Luteibacter sp.]
MNRLVAFLLLWLGTGMAMATPPPADLDARAGFDQRLGAALTMTAQVTDQDGHTRTLGQLAHGKPLLLAFGYYRCPNLCDLTLHGMAQAVATMPLDPATDFHVLFLGIDPRESSADARQARSMLASMGKRGRPETWTFATADARTVASLTHDAGFRYFFDRGTAQYVHPAGMIVVTPEGRIAQYFFGVGYDPGALRLALVDASGGHLGNVIDRLVLLCCGYDPASGRYTLLISRVTMILGSLFVLGMLAGIYRLRRRAP